MFLVNIVYDDEELLEPYEWQEDDCLKEYVSIPCYHVTHEQLHDFMYGKLCIKNNVESLFIVGDGHYNVVIFLKDHCIDKRGSLTFSKRYEVNKIILKQPIELFEYQVLEEAYEKEFGLTRDERMKKICLEEVIDEIFVVHYDLFVDICHQCYIYEEGANEQYLALKNKIEKGYTSLHELLYKELVQKR